MLRILIRLINSIGLLSLLLLFVLGEITAQCANSDVMTIAGDGMSAQLRGPIGVEIDNNGNIIVAETGNHRIRRISPNGVVTTIAGGTPGYIDANGTSAQFLFPYGVAMDNSGNIIVADALNHCIRRISPNGDVTTIAGGAPGYMDANGASAQFFLPRDVVIDNDGSIIVADGGNHRIRRISPNGDVTTIAGGTPGYMDANGTFGQFLFPNGVVIDDNGVIIVADSGNHRIRRISPNGDVTTIAGGMPGYMDANSTFAQFDYPYRVTIDNNGNMIVADSRNHRIRRISPNGDVTTVAGSTRGYLDAYGTSARFGLPTDVAVDNSGNIIVADIGNHRMRQIGNCTVDIVSSESIPTLSEWSVMILTLLLSVVSILVIRRMNKMNTFSIIGYK